MKDPPKQAMRFLRWFCPPQLYEGIEGDLLEEFQAHQQAHGLRGARRRLMLGVLRFFRPGIVFRNRFSFQLIDMIMFRNYIAIAYRNVLKNKAFLKNVRQRPSNQS